MKKLLFTALLVLGLVGVTWVAWGEDSWEDLEKRMVEVMIQTIKESSIKAEMTSQIFAAVDKGDAIWETCLYQTINCATIYVDEDLWDEIQQAEKELMFSSSVAPYGYWIQPMSEYKEKEEKKPKIKETMI